MLFIWFIYILVLYVKSQNAHFVKNEGKPFYKLELQNDGPVTFDVPVTVSANLTGGPKNTSFLYLFEDNLQRVVKVVGKHRATALFIFNDQPGIHDIQVHVFFEDEHIISGVSPVAVHEYIPGYLNLTRTIEDKDGKKFIGTGWDTNITLDLHLPAYVKKDSEFAYSWTLGDDKFTSDYSFLIYNFKDSGLKLIQVAVVGRVPSYDGSDSFHYKWGYFDMEITVKDPFSYINISGNTYLDHGQLLNLDISCDGSGPVDYCWKLLPLNENNTMLSCTNPVTAVDCSIPILYYFRDSGEYQLAIYVSNLVTSMQRIIEVHIYDVSLRPQLSMVIFPVACSIMVVIIIAAGIIIQMRRNAGYSIETADFDFMRIESAVAVETSWERMWRSLVHLLQLRCFCQSVENELTNAQYGTILTGN